VTWAKKKVFIKLWPFFPFLLPPQMFPHLKASVLSCYKNKTLETRYSIKNKNLFSQSLEAGKFKIKALASLVLWLGLLSASKMAP
jgi:hypothetical protein